MNVPRGLQRGDPFPVCCYANAVLQAIKFSGIDVPDELKQREPSAYVLYEDLVKTVDL